MREVVTKDWHGSGNQRHPNPNPLSNFSDPTPSSFHFSLPFHSIPTKRLTIPTPSHPHVSQPHHHNYPENTCTQVIHLQVQEQNVFERKCKCRFNQQRTANLWPKSVRYANACFRLFFLENFTYTIEKCDFRSRGNTTDVIPSARPPHLRVFWLHYGGSTVKFTSITAVIQRLQQ